MSWLRLSDDCFQYPKLLEALGYAPDDPRLRLELFGFIVALATLSASHNTDYIISYGHIQTVGGGRGTELTELCEKVGLLVKTSESPAKWMIHQDSEFLHMRFKNDVMWDRQQRNDNNNPALYGPVRKRDGDNCRWCGVAVVWRGPNKNARKGSLDHLKPGEAATIDTLVVSCLNCNASRGKSAFGPEGRELLPPPTRPRYTQTTTEDLEKIGIYVEQNTGVSEKTAPTVCQEPSTVSSGSQVDPAGRDAVSECELSSQAIQPEEDPYFGMSVSEIPADVLHESPAGRLSSQAIQPEEDPAVTKPAPTPQPAEVTARQNNDSLGGGVETPADAKTEAVETPLPPSETSTLSPLTKVIRERAPIKASAESPPSLCGVSAESIDSLRLKTPRNRGKPIKVCSESTQSLPGVSQKSIDSLQTPTLLSGDSPGRVGSGLDGAGLCGTGRGGKPAPSCCENKSSDTSVPAVASSGGKRSRRRRK